MVKCLGLAAESNGGKNGGRNKIGHDSVIIEAGWQYKATRLTDLPNFVYV